MGSCLLSTRVRVRQTRLLALAIAAITAWALAGCDNPPPASDAGLDAAPADASVVPDGAVLCVDDSECDDGIACTRDSCDPTYRFCQHGLDNAMCDDNVFCNGVEQCNPRSGCVPGSRETCNDMDVCTIDRCNEVEKNCDHFPRDLDEDGDADFFCEGGNDCDDRDPTRSSMVPEICDDLVDNDCDGIDDDAASAMMCGRPMNDACDDPLDVSAGGTFALDVSGATADYMFGCVSSLRPDLVLTFTLTEERNVEIEAEGDFLQTAVSLRTTCTDRASEVECRTGYPTVLRRRALPAGTYFVVVAGYFAGEIALTVRFTDPTPAATNDSCTSPIDVSAGGTFRGSMIDIADDHATSCGFGGAPDLVYTFTTLEERDVRVTATATSGDSMAWEIRSTCEAGGSVRCAQGAPSTGRVHQLPAGTYFLVLEGPSYTEVDFQLDVELLAPTPPLTGDLCASPLPLTLGARTPGSLMDMEDDIETTCGYDYRDVVYSFELTERRDVTVEIDGGTTFFNASVRPSCGDSVTQIRCASGAPLRMRMRDLPPGTYFVVVESYRASSFNITATATPVSMPVAVSLNDACGTAHVVPATGGLFTGDTSAMANDYSTALCFVPADSPDAVFRLDLTTRQRVVASTDGTGFDTELHMHTTMCRSGGETVCDDDGGDGSASLIDRTLDPGTYYFVVDGYGTTNSGAYSLEIIVSAP